MSWDRVKSSSIAVAVALFLIANAPPIIVDPLKTAVAQIRHESTPSAPSQDVGDASSTSDVVLGVLKKALK